MSPWGQLEWVLVRKSFLSFKSCKSLIPTLQRKPIQYTTWIKNTVTECSAGNELPFLRVQSFLYNFPFSPSLFWKFSHFQWTSMLFPPSQALLNESPSIYHLPNWSGDANHSFGYPSSRFLSDVNLKNIEFSILNLQE